jgi:hypothetical protein
VSYRVQFEGPALVQLKGLPEAIFDALVERVTGLVREPWDVDLMTPGEDRAYRQAVFGYGYGLPGLPVLREPGPSQDPKISPVRWSKVEYLWERPQAPTCAPQATPSRSYPWPTAHQATPSNVE